MGKKVEVRLPKALGAIIDLLWDTRADRLALEKKVAAIASREQAIKDHLGKLYKKSKLEGAKGNKAQMNVEIVPVPNIEDFDKVWAFAVKHDAGELFQRRLNVSACRERWEAGIAIPGVTKFDSVKYSLTKVRGGK